MFKTGLIPALLRLASACAASIAVTLENTVVNRKTSGDSVRIRRVPIVPFKKPYTHPYLYQFLDAIFEIIHTSLVSFYLKQI